MTQKPPEIAAGKCGAEEGSTQPLESGPATQDDITDNDHDDDDEVVIVTY